MDCAIPRFPSARCIDHCYFISQSGIFQDKNFRKPQKTGKRSMLFVDKISTMKNIYNKPFIPDVA